MLSSLIPRSQGTIENWRSQGVPKRAAIEVSAFMEAYDCERAEQLRELDKLVIEVESEQFDNWNRAALSQGLIVREWAIRGLNDLAEQKLSEPLSLVAEDEVRYSSNKEKNS